MHHFYLYLFVIICFGLLGWGMMRLERIYQYPFFMGATFISFIVPQAFSLTNNPGVVSDRALERVFLMACLCAAMCWIGYQFSPDPKLLKKLNIEIDDRKLFKAGVALMIFGHFFNFLLSRTNIETAANGNWTGRATIYVFFAKVLYIAFAIFLRQTLKDFKLKYIFCTLITAYPLLSSILISGRRQSTIAFVVIIGVLFWFVKRFTVPRFIILAFSLLGIYFIRLLGSMRGNLWGHIATNKWEQIMSTSQDSMEVLLQGKILELRNAALLMDASVMTGRHGYGTGYWDNIVFQYFPGQIFGHGLKKALQFNWGTNHYLKYLYHYTIHPGTTFTGIGDSFVEFDYFGCLVFALIAFLFKTLWFSSNYYKSTLGTLLYAALITPAMVAITHGTGRFIQEGIFQVGVLGLVTLFARKKTNLDRYNLENYRNLQ
ncbi:MAG: hypothetical protein QNJ41_10545 [Xenococcaceae cyanobacterium MO_188.B32]|nr:hypothetical protein [Xenococcaceae cyanobacterium MO_188.B32]